MALKDRVIDVFESRVNKLTQITNTTKLPQWIDADIIAAHCLLMEYRKLVKQSDALEKDERNRRPWLEKL